MHVRYLKDARENREFGCDLQRFYPWREVVRTSNTSWGSALATVRPGEGTVPHSHAEHETFIITAGRACMTIGDESSQMTVGDVVYIPPNSEHDIRNLSDDELLQFVTIWVAAISQWGRCAGRRQRCGRGVHDLMRRHRRRLTRAGVAASKNRWCVMTGQKQYLAVMAFAISNDAAKSESLSTYYPFMKAILKFAPSAPGFAPQQPARGAMAHPRFYTSADKELNRAVPQALFMWEDVESLMAFTYHGLHGEALKENRKESWFIKTDRWPAYVMWWSDAESATYKAGCRRLEHLHDHGPSAYAFNFKQPFAPDGEPYEIDREKVAAYRAWYIDNPMPRPVP